jgi:steroid delta-isomerase-like uncharacterized protein
MSQILHSVVAEPLVRTTVDNLPAGPALLALARFRYAPRARFGPAAGPGPVAFVVESGTLVFSAQGEVALRRAGSPGGFTAPAPNKEFTVQPGDEVLIPGDVVHAVRNTGTTPATILGAATFPGGGPPRQFPDGVAFIPLVMSQVSALAPAPADYAVNRITLAAGSRDADVFHAGPGLHYVESGTLDLRIGQGEVAISRDAQAGRTETARAGQQVQLAAGEGAIVPAGSVVSIGNSGAGDAVVLSLRTGAAGGISGAVTAEPDNRAILAKFITSVMDSAKPENASQFLAPNFISHDAPPGPAGQAGAVVFDKADFAGVVSFLKNVIFPAFSGFKTGFKIVIQDGDLVAGQWIQNFKHTGDGYFGARATQANIAVQGFTIVRVKDGKMTEHWEQRDIASWHKQIGLGFALGGLANTSGLDARAAAATTPDKELVAKFYEAWNKKDAATLSGLLTSDFVNNHPMQGQQAGREGMIQFMNAFHGALGGCQVVVDLLVGDGAGTVFARVRYSGTHQNTLLGIPATGKPIEIPAIEVFTTRGSQISARTGQLDEALLAVELGVFSPGSGTGSGG